MDDGEASARASPAGWCSLRLRFAPEELALLGAAEHTYGAHLARQPRADALRSAIALARVGRKVAAGAPGAPTSLREHELLALLEALRFAAAEVRWLGEHGAQATDRASRERREHVEKGFPELAANVWRAFGTGQALDRLARRLDQAHHARHVALPGPGG